MPTVVPRCHEFKEKILRSLRSFAAISAGSFQSSQFRILRRVLGRHYTTEAEEIEARNRSEAAERSKQVGGNVTEP
jgi:hypothetical protein